MAADTRRRNVLVALLLLLVLIALLLLRCRKPEPAPAERVDAPGRITAEAQAEPQPGAAPSPAAETAEVLTAATLEAPDEVGAGAEFPVAWTGPANEGDYVTIARADAPSEAALHYRETRAGATLALTAPVDAGAYELRYVTARSRTILGRRPLVVVEASATLSAADEVTLGSELSVAWTGPDNEGDYITLVPADLPDGRYAQYATTSAGSPLTVLAPTTAGAGELRYMTGQGHEVLARRPVRIVMPEVTLSAADEVVAGAKLEVAWTGPDNAGDYVTIVAADARDGQYGNYTQTSSGSPLSVLVPILTGPAELRYMTGRDAKVLARRPLSIVAAEVTLDAPEEAAAGSAVRITWTGPNHGGDYVTIVAASAADGQFGSYTQTTSGSPLEVKAPKDAGDAEVRYMTGQGGKVLARRAIRIVP